MTATNEGESTVAPSEATSLISSASPANIVASSITGTDEIDQTLNAEVGYRPAKEL